MLHGTFRQYVAGTAKVGIGLGIVTILARWVTGNSLLAAPDMLVKYGILGGIGYSLVFSLTLVLFAFVAKRIRDVLPDGETIGDFLLYRLPPAGYRLMLGFVSITSLHGMYLQSWAAGSILEHLFHIPVPLGLLLFLLFTVLYAGVGGAKLINNIALFQIAFVFAAAILLPVYFFVGEGVGRIYDGMRLYHPYLLVLNNPDSWLLISAGIFIGGGQILSDRTMWQRLFTLEEKKIVPTLVLSGLIWLTLPIGLTSLVMIAIYSGGFTNMQSLLLKLAENIHSPFLFVLFVISLMSIVTASFGAELHSLVCLYVRHVFQVARPDAGEKKLLETGYRTAGTITVVVFLVTISFSPGLLSVFFSSG